MSNDDKNANRVEKGQTFNTEIENTSDCKHESNDENTRNNMIKKSLFESDEAFDKSGRKKRAEVENTFLIANMKIRMRMQEIT